MSDDGSTPEPSRVLHLLDTCERLRTQNTQLRQKLLVESERLHALLEHNDALIDTCNMLNHFFADGSLLRDATSVPHRTRHASIEQSAHIFRY